MRLVKLPAMNLEPGMFVAELDRPWLETPFAVQGFVVRDTDEILYVSNYVDHVYVDAEYTGVQQSLKLKVAAMESSDPAGTWPRLQTRCGSTWSCGWRTRT